MNINLSLVDYIGKLENGVAVILSLVIDEEQYEIIYWFNRNSDYRINIEQKFYDNFPHIKNIYDYEYLYELLYYIDNKILPNKEEIFNEFLN